MGGGAIASAGVAAAIFSNDKPPLLEKNSSKTGEKAKASMNDARTLPIQPSQQPCLTALLLVKMEFARSKFVSIDPGHASDPCSHQSTTKIRVVDLPDLFTPISSVDQKSCRSAGSVHPNPIRP
ncbi:hypothetical protein ACLOJK_016365 [Asimina triloba]